MDIRVLGFKTEYNKGKSRDMVLYAPGGAVQSTQTWAYIEHLRPPAEFENHRDQNGDKMFHMKAVWSVLEPKYNAWKAGQELPEYGTPIVSWPAVNEGQARELIRHGLKTVEDLASLSEGGLEKIRLPDVRKLRTAAKEYVSGKDRADMATRLTETEERLAAAMALLEELKPKDEEAKPKRGRPPKAKTEEAA